jgi:hypothetical protein
LDEHHGLAIERSMSTFIVGTNRFEDCEILIAHKAVPVLRIDITDGVPCVDLRMPEGAGKLVIERNAVRAGSAEVVASLRSATVTSAELMLLHVVVKAGGEALVHLDLRSLGVAIYTDASGLHIGSNVLSRNRVKGARIAIGLS